MLDLRSLFVLVPPLLAFALAACAPLSRSWRGRLPDRSGGALLDFYLLAGAVTLFLAVVAAALGAAAFQEHFVYFAAFSFCGIFASWGLQIDSLRSVAIVIFAVALLFAAALPGRGKQQRFAGGADRSESVGSVSAFFLFAGGALCCLLSTDLVQTVVVWLAFPAALYWRRRTLYPRPAWQFANAAWLAASSAAGSLGLISIVWLSQAGHGSDPHILRMSLPGNPNFGLLVAGLAFVLSALVRVGLLPCNLRNPFFAPHLAPRDEALTRILISVVEVCILLRLVYGLLPSWTLQTLAQPAILLVAALVTWCQISAARSRRPSRAQRAIGFPQVGLALLAALLGTQAGATLALTQTLSQVLSGVVALSLTSGKPRVGPVIAKGLLALMVVGVPPFLGCRVVPHLLLSLWRSGTLGAVAGSVLAVGLTVQGARLFVLARQQETPTRLPTAPTRVPAVWLAATVVSVVMGAWFEPWSRAIASAVAVLRPSLPG